jgi:hypothetical protein
MIRRMSVAAFLLAVVFSAVPAFAGDDYVYMYDDAIAGEVDLSRFTQKGEVAFLQGISQFCDTDKGPAPEPYPHIHVWEPGIEQLGSSNVEMDGMWFINLGRHWVKNKLALVLWKIRIPNANQRMVSEFAEDMTLSMWVDWDQNESWDKDELQIRKNLNLAHFFPTNKPVLTVYYLTCFRVPDIEELLSAEWGLPKWNKEILYFWVRGSLACDDPDVSADGEQLFGEAEDYRVSYMKMTKRDNWKR